MDLFVEPVFERQEFSASELIVETAEFFVGGVEELRGVHVAQRVRWEVSKQSGAPVNVLQATVRIVIGRDAKVAVESFVPDAGQFGRLQIAGQHCLLQLKPQHDVQVVGDFVGFDSDERWPNIVDGPVKLFLCHIQEGIWKRGLSFREEVLPESWTAANEILPHPRLRFVDAQRNGLAHRRAKCVFVKTLLVNAVAGFVQRPEESSGEMMFVISRGEAAVAGAETAAEWMSGDIQPPGIETETNSRRGFDA